MWESVGILFSYIDKKVRYKLWEVTIMFYTSVWKEEMPTLFK